MDNDFLIPTSYNYAQIDEKCYCIGISTLSGIVEHENMIFIGDEVVEFGQKYDLDNKVWLDEFKPEEPQEPIVTEGELIQQRFTDLELQNLEGQLERQMLAQQMSDLELILLGGI